MEIKQEIIDALNLKDMNEKKEKEPLNTPTSFLNFKFLGRKLLERLKKKTGVDLTYGSITFTYHNGVCVNVDACPTFRLHQTRSSVPVVKMKLLKGKS